MKITLIVVIVLACLACNTDQAGPDHEFYKTSYLKQGDSIVKITFDTLRSTLLRTMGENGVPGAIRFCNEQALPITSLYAAEGVMISRITDKTRNPKNTLGENDKVIWEKYIASVANKDSLQSKLVFKGNEVHFYKPIIVQPMCLSCHGTVGKELAQEQLKVIDSLYPSDQARGYRAGDLRGMWHVVFTKDTGIVVKPSLQ